MGHSPRWTAAQVLPWSEQQPQRNGQLHTPLSTGGFLEKVLQLVPTAPGPLLPSWLLVPPPPEQQTPENWVVCMQAAERRTAQVTWVLAAGCARPPVGWRSSSRLQRRECSWGWWPALAHQPATLQAGKATGEVTASDPAPAFSKLKPVKQLRNSPAPTVAEAEESMVGDKLQLENKSLTSLTDA